MQADVERFLARLYADGEVRQRFLRHPRQVAEEHGLTSAECEAMAAISKEDLCTASRSFERKRTLKEHHRRHAGVRLMEWLRRMAGFIISNRS